MNFLELSILSFGFGIILAFLILMIYQTKEKLDQKKIVKKAKEIQEMPDAQRNELLKYNAESIKEVDKNGRTTKQYYRKLSDLREAESRERAVEVRYRQLPVLSDAYGREVVSRSITGNSKQAFGNVGSTMGNTEGNQSQVRNVSPKIEF